MADEDRAALLRAPIVHPAPAADAVAVRRDVIFDRTAVGALRLDLYTPAAAGGAGLPAVLIVAGYPDASGRIRQMGWAVSWARLLAASGMAVAIYANDEPCRTARRAFAYLAGGEASADGLPIDPGRIAVLAASGGVPTAVDLVMAEPRVARAVFYYGFLLDAAGESTVADAAAAFGFATASPGRSIDDVPPDLPLFVVRAGADAFAGLADGLSRFVSAAVQRNLAITFVNLPEAPHAFDLVDDRDRSREVIAQTVAFLRAAGPRAGV